jgi:rhomboid protease GluP
LRRGWPEPSEGDLEAEEEPSPLRETVRVRRDAQGRLIRPREEPAAIQGRPTEEEAEPDDLLSSTRPLGSWVILAICCAVQAGIWWTGEGMYALLRFGASDPGLVAGGQYWRVYTSSFVHFSWIHLAINMLGLFFMGPILERYYGTVAFLALYSWAGLAGGAMVLVGAPDAVSGGAAPALFGLCGAAAILLARQGSRLATSTRTGLFSGMVPVLGYNVLVGLLVSGLVAEGGINARISLLGALVGLVAGVLFAAAVPSPRLAPRGLGRMLTPLWALLALAPFIAEGALFYAMVAGGGPVHMATERFSFDRPPGLVPIRESGGEVRCLGPGFALVISAEVAARPVGTVDAERVGLLRKLQNQGLSLSRHDTTDIAGRRWLIVDGTVASGSIERVALATEGRTVYSVEIAQAKTTDAGARALQAVLETFAAAASESKPTRKSSRAPRQGRSAAPSAAAEAGPSSRPADTRSSGAAEAPPGTPVPGKDSGSRRPAR